MNKISALVLFFLAGSVQAGERLSGQSLSQNLTISTLTTNGSFTAVASATVRGADAQGYSLKLSSGLTMPNGTVTANMFQGNGAALTGVRVDTSAIAGQFGDDRVAISTAGVVAGKFQDNRVDITTGALSGVLPVAKGGTGSTNTAAALASLGAAARGSNADITSIAGLVTLSSALTHTATVTVAAQNAAGYSLFLSSGLNMPLGTLNAANLQGNGAAVTEVFAASVSAGGVQPGPLGSGVVASSVATVLPGLDSCGSATQSCVLLFGQDGRARFVSTVTITGSGGSSVGWSRDASGVVYLTTVTDNVLVQTTMTVAGARFSVGASTLIVRDGNVAIATVTTAASPSRLTVNGMVESLSGGFKMPDGSVLSSTAGLSGGGGSGSGVGWSRDNAGNFIYVTTATDNVIIQSTLTVQGGGGSQFSVKTSTGIKLDNGCIQFPSGRLQCDASPSPLVLASPSNGNYRVGVADDGALTTTPTADAALPDVQLISPNGTSYRMGVSNDGALTTRPSN